MLCIIIYWAVCPTLTSPMVFLLVYFLLTMPFSFSLSLEVKLMCSGDVSLTEVSVITYWLCDLCKITRSLCASVSPYVK